MTAPPGLVASYKPAISAGFSARYFRSVFPLPRNRFTLPRISFEGALASAPTYFLTIAAAVTFSNVRFAAPPAGGS